MNVIMILMYDRLLNSISILSDTILCNYKVQLMNPGNREYP